ncbi:MAG: hypothetical protein IJ776_11290 [Paludibacteraceae bacterium]|nr:hypothetical protein [Paludibacteraceae bacterium]
MKRSILLISLGLLIANLCAFSQSGITAGDHDFGTVSIKGQSSVTGTADIPVSWQNLPDGGTVYAELTSGEADPDGFYIEGDNYYYIGYGATLTSKTTFQIGYVAAKAGKYTGTIRFYAYDSSWTNEVEKVITVTLTVTDEAIVEQVATFTKVTAVSQLAAGDTVVFVSEDEGVVCGPLNGAYLPAVSENVKMDKQKGTVEVPLAAQTFVLGKYNGNWQFTATGTTDRLLSDVSGKGGFSYGEPSQTLLAGWAIDISEGRARVSRPSDDTYPVLFNKDRFKPYKSETAGVLPCLYKKSGGYASITSSLKLSSDIVFGDVEQSKTKSVEVEYVGENLTEMILWDVDGVDKAFFTVSDQGSSSAGKIVVTYNGEAATPGKLDAKVIYLTQDAELELMEGSFPISINIIANADPTAVLSDKALLEKAGEKTLTNGSLRLLMPDGTVYDALGKKLK